MKNSNLLIGVIESLVVNIIIYLLFFELQSNQETYFSLNPHPILFLCIFIGTRYGLKIAFISAFLSTIFYIKAFSDLHNSLALLLIYFENYKYILLYFWSAVIFGSLKDNHGAKIEQLTGHIYMLEKKYRDLEKSYNVSVRIQNEMKKQIINSEESILHLYEIAEKLNTLEVEEIYTEALGILAKYLRADSISIYTYDERSNFLRLKVNLGEYSFENRSSKVKEHEGLFKVISEKRAFKWSEIQGTFPLMSAPLIKDNKVIGVVNIENMEFERISEYAFQLFKIIIAWINDAMSKAYFVDNLRDDKYLSETNILKIEFFNKRLAEEERRRNDFNLEYVYFKYEVNGLALKELNQYMVSKVFRSVDIVSYEPERKTLHVLLPATSLESLSIIKARINSKWCNFLAEIA